MRRSNSTLISYSATFSNPSNMSMNEAWTWSEFCFLWDVAFPGEVACGTWWGPFLAATTLPWGRGQGGSKAAVHLPDVRAENFLELFPRFKSLLGPNYWEFDRSTDTENVYPSETGCLQLCRRWKFWKTKPFGCQAGEAVGWTWKVWKEQNLILNQLLLWVMSYELSWFQSVY